MKDDLISCPEGPGCPPSRGVPLDEVASAIGHSTPAVTARHYAHFVRKTFSPLMTAGLEAGVSLPADEPEKKRATTNSRR
jgi:hypothetical protein